jgi:hypothetical protein
LNEAALEFLTVVLPESGFLIGLAKRGSERRQSVFGGPGGLERLVEWLESWDQRGWDVYHALSAFRDQRGVWDDQAKRHRPRAQANVFSHRCLALDADTKESHNLATYKDRVEAWDATLAFCRAAGLPPPIFVSSGGGLHIYWTFDRDIDPDLWQRLADGLKRACFRHGFHADHKLTSNSSAVLRTPGFTHQRLRRTVEVGEITGPYNPEQFLHLLEGEDEHRNKRLSSEQPERLDSPVARAARENIRTTGSDPVAMRNHCRQLAAFAQQPGDFREPFHRLTAGAYKASGNPEFYLGMLDPKWRADGQQKLDGWTRTDREGRLAAPYCSSFYEERPEGCKGCPWFDETQEGHNRFKISSPVHAGRLATGSASKVSSGISNGSGQKDAEEKAQVNGNVYHIKPHLCGIALPDGYIINEQDQLIMPIQDKKTHENKDLVISDHAIYLAGVYESEAGAVGGCTYAFRQWHPHKGFTPISIAAGDLWTAHGMVALANGGANILDAGLFKQFVQASVDRMNHMQKPIFRFEQYGWKNGYTEFLIGTTMISQGGNYEVIVNDELATRAQWLGPTPHGSVRRWREIVTELLPAHDAAGWFTVLCSLGAVFVSWQNPDESCGVVNNREINSGTGKTSRLKIAASIWGQWQGLLITNYDTGPSQGFMRAAICHLPFIHDELANQVQKDPSQLPAYIGLLTEGRDKRRMEAGGKGIRYCGLSWSTMELTASNPSMLDILRMHSKGTDAQIQRLMEMRSKTEPHLSPAYAEELLKELFENAGHVGREFLEFVVRNVEWCQQKIKEWQDRIYKNTNFRQKHRFYVRTLVAAAVAGEVCEALGGLLPVDFRKVMHEILREQGALTGQERPEEVQGGDGIEALHQFLSQNLRGLMRVHGPYVPGTPLTPPITAPADQLVIRYEMSNGRIYFPTRVFRDFCTKNGFSFSDCIEKLEESKFVLHHDRHASLGAGTTVPGVRTRCVELDFKHPMSTQMPRLITEQEGQNDQRT